MEVPRARMGTGIVEFAGTDTCRGVAGHIADVVGARPARGEAQILHRFDDMDRVLRRDLPELQIGASSDMGISAAEFFGESGYPRELPMRQNAIGDSQAAHVTVLGRRDIEETVKLPTEIIGRLRIFVARGLAAQLVIRIEGMLFALPLLLIDEFLAGLDRFVLGQAMRRIGTHWRWLRRGLWRVGGSHKSIASPGPDAGNETFKIALLFGSEVARHRKASRRLRESELGPEGEDVAPMRHGAPGGDQMEDQKAARRIPKQHGAGQSPVAHHELFIA